LARRIKTADTRSAEAAMTSPRMSDDMVASLL